MKKIMMIALLSLVSVLYGCTNTKDFDSSKKISVYTRDTTSGTRAGFMEGIGFSEGATNDSLLVNGYVTKDNTGIMTSVATDLYAIGYISLSSVDDSLKGVNFEGVAPTIQNVMNDTYGLKRPFMWMLRDQGDYETPEIEALVNAFVAFLGTTDAADIINNNGKIDIELFKTDEVIFRVKDTRVGIPNDQKDKIFEHFYQINKTRSKLQNGTGLGLAIVKHVTSYYEGQIVVESKEEVGTTITVLLP